MGGEPTFTDRFSQEREWLFDANGPTKEAWARGLLAALSETTPDALILRTCGRQYPGEPVPRFSYGRYRFRTPASTTPWAGLVDPLLKEPVAATPVAPDAAAGQDWRDGLARRLAGCGFTCMSFEVAGAFPYRLVFHEGEPRKLDFENDPRLARESIHLPADPKQVAVDELAQEGLYLVCFRGICDETTGGHPAIRVELPAFADVARYLAFLKELADSNREAGGVAAVLTGFPPPVDGSIAWMTVTPDPGVIEINMAPAPDVSTHLTWYREIFAAARRVELEPLRYRYNGDLADSGGGGHITLGGPTALSSPFFLWPQLLPRLVTYLNRHPALSYAFAVDSLGSSSQSPRPDEGLEESFEELGVALRLLTQQPATTPVELWTALAPFLTDHSGNTHRAEINVEKLWNPYLPVRGNLGVVELRAFRMPRSPERAAALACLLRALVATLRVAPPETLVSWGPDLHDRFALPFYLLKDLAEVLADLREYGFGLSEPIERELLDDSARLVGSIELPGATLIFKQAVEFWPVLGDLSAQEGRTSRLLDASTGRLEVTLRSGDDEALEGFRVSTLGYRLPMVRDRDQDSSVLLCGLRYRSFVPNVGLHPNLKSHLPLELSISHEGRPGTTVVQLFDWIPGGGTYDGLPVDGSEARRRRDERVVVQQVSEPPGEASPPPDALSLYTLDLRKL